MAGADANGGDGAAAGGKERLDGVTRGRNVLEVADCNPVRAWAYLLGALPKVRHEHDDCGNSR